MSDSEIVNPTQELGYSFKRSGLYLLGKQMAKEAGHALEHTGESAAQSIGQTFQSTMGDVIGPDMARNIGAFAGGMGTTLAGLTTIGLSAAVSAGLTQMDYVHKRDALRDTYKEELAAKLHKPVKQVTTSDIDILAKENKTLDEHLKKTKKERNFGVGLSFLASMASLAVVSFAIAPLLAGAGLAVGFTTAAGLAGFAISAVASLATYHLVKDPLHMVADKLFDLHTKTAHDRIAAIKIGHDAGKVISREQVLSVFIAAHPEVGQTIVAQYGKHFDNLDEGTQKRVAEAMNQIIPLDKMTLDINAGTMKASELAFAVEGQISGAQFLKPEDKKDAPTMWERVTSVFSFKSTAKVEVKTEQTAAGVSTRAEASATVQTEERQGKPFVERLGLAKKSPSLSHVERLDQGRADQAVLNLQQQV